MLNVIKYTYEFKSIWNEFISKAKNSHFMFYREYVEYHADRFEDFSVLFYKNAKLIAVMPANIKNQVLYSHQGLTFGGIIVNNSITAIDMLEIFENLIKFMKNKGFHKFIYKCMPHIYHLQPAEEDLYALFINQARLVRRDISSSIILNNHIGYYRGKRSSIIKASKNNLEIFESQDYSAFWSLLSTVLLNRHGTTPVHSYSEINLLSTLFPNNIKLFVVKKNDELLAGAVIYECNNVAHTQYLANSDLGRDLRALDFLIDYLITDVYANAKYFDLGTSNEDNGRFLNRGLIRQKSSFGARSVVHDFYELDL